MEYCGGGSVSNACQTIQTSLTENQIALICRETLLVIIFSFIKISGINEKG